MGTSAMVSDELVREASLNIRGIPRLTGHYADGCITWDDGELEAALRDFATAVEAAREDRKLREVRDVALESAARMAEARERQYFEAEKKGNGTYATMVAGVVLGKLAASIRALKSFPVQEENDA